MYRTLFVTMQYRNQQIFQPGKNLIYRFIDYNLIKSKFKLDKTKIK